MHTTTLQFVSHISLFSLVHTTIHHLVKLIYNEFTYWVWFNISLIPLQPDMDTFLLTPPHPETTKKHQVLCIRIIWWGFHLGFYYSSIDWPKVNFRPRSTLANRGLCGLYHGLLGFPNAMHISSEKTQKHGVIGVQVLHQQLGHLDGHTKVTSLL